VGEQDGEHGGQVGLGRDSDLLGVDVEASYSVGPGQQPQHLGDADLGGDPDHEVAAAYGTAFDVEHPDDVLRRLGALSRVVGATLRNTANPTMLNAGYKTNVIPGRAEAQIDGRTLPGYEDEFFATIDELLGAEVRREMVNYDVPLETTFDGALVEAMSAAVHAEDPAGRAVPYCLSGGTDAKAFSTLGIRGFGFSPLRLPPDLDFTGMFHGVDERVPVDALQFGARVLDRLFDSC